MAVGGKIFYNLKEQVQFYNRELVPLHSFQLFKRYSTLKLNIVRKSTYNAFMFAYYFKKFLTNDI